MDKQDIKFSVFLTLCTSGVMLTVLIPAWCYDYELFKVSWWLGPSSVVLLALMSFKTVKRWNEESKQLIEDGEEYHPYTQWKAKQQENQNGGGI